MTFNTTVLMNVWSAAYFFWKCCFKHQPATQPTDQPFLHNSAPPSPKTCRVCAHPHPIPRKFNQILTIPLQKLSVLQSFSIRHLWPTLQCYIHYWKALCWSVCTARSLTSWLIYHIAVTKECSWFCLVVLLNDPLDKPMYCTHGYTQRNFSHLPCYFHLL